MADQQETDINLLYTTFVNLAKQGSQLSNLSKVVSPLRQLDDSLHELEHNPIGPSRALFSLRQELSAKASSSSSSFKKEDLQHLLSEVAAVEPGLQAHTRLVDMLMIFLRNHPNPALSLAVVGLFPAHLAAGDAVKPQKIPSKAFAEVTQKRQKVAKPNEAWVKNLRKTKEVKNMEKLLGGTKEGLMSCLLLDLEESPHALSSEEAKGLETLVLEKLFPLMKKMGKGLHAGDTAKSTFFHDVFCKTKGDLGESSKDSRALVEKLFANLSVKLEVTESLPPDMSAGVAKVEELD